MSKQNQSIIDYMIARVRSEFSYRFESLEILPENIDWIDGVYLLGTGAAENNVGMSFRCRQFCNEDENVLLERENLFVYEFPFHGSYIPDQRREVLRESLRRSSEEADTKREIRENDLVRRLLVRCTLNPQTSSWEQGRGIAKELLFAPLSDLVDGTLFVYPHDFKTITGINLPTVNPSIRFPCAFDAEVELKQSVTVDEVIKRLSSNLSFPSSGESLTARYGLRATTEAPAISEVRIRGRHF